MQEDSAKFDYTLAGEKVLSIIVRRTEDGLLWIVPAREIGDIHLIMIVKDGRFNWHITDGRESDKIKRYPYSTHLPVDEFNKRIYEYTQRFIKRYHGNCKAYVMRKKLKNKVRKELTNLGLNQATIPLETFNIAVLADFQNNRRWKRIRIKDLLSQGELAGFVIDKGIIRIALPIDSTKAIFISEKQFEKFHEQIAKLMGLEEYLHYVLPLVEESIGKQIRSIFQTLKSRR